MEKKISHREINVKQICLASMGWMVLTTLLILIPNVSTWIVTPVFLIGIVGVLGLLLAVNLNLPSEKLSEYIFYTTGLGLTYVMLGGLVINWGFPYLGISKPLASLPLMFFFDISTIVLSAYAYFLRREYAIAFNPPILDGTSSFFAIVPASFVVMSVAGAEILNNGGNGTLTLAMLFGIAFYVLVLMGSRRRVRQWVYIPALYCISLALLLMYSLRSSHILGWDINQEYQVFQMTLQNLVWKMSYYPGLDYNACLSITILPTIFKVLTNMPSEYVFKVTFQLLFATVPVTVYVIARRYLTESLAFLAAFLLLSQRWFFEQLPALTRQEVAFIFFVFILLVLFDAQMPKRTRHVLFYLFSMVLILSHYSTAYIWLTLMFGTLILSYAARLLFSPFRDRVMILTPTMFGISLALLFIWQVPLTSTAGHFAAFATNNDGQISITSTGGTTSPASLTPLRVVGGIVVAPVALPLIAIESVARTGIMTALFASPDLNTDRNIQFVEQITLSELEKKNWIPGILRYRSIGIHSKSS